MKLKTVLVPVAVLIILFPLGYSVLRSVFSHGAEDGQPFLDRPDKKYENCVRETTYMRYRHMDFLKQIRNEAVRDCKRGEIGINSCRECHPSRERFCNQCHNAVNLYPDCFRCHYYP